MNDCEYAAVEIMGWEHRHDESADGIHVSDYFIPTGARWANEYLFDWRPDTDRNQLYLLKVRMAELGLWPDQPLNDRLCMNNPEKALAAICRAHKEANK